MIAWFLLGSAMAYGLVIAIYRLHIHPLSRFPGPRLAALTGLYEVVCTAWGADSFDDEIERIHHIYGPIVRITPDEVHVQEQFYSPQYADRWIKGIKVLDTPRHQSGDTTTQRFQNGKRSIWQVRWQVRSILQVEVHQIIRDLVRKHQAYRVFSWKGGPVIPMTALHKTRAGSSEASDLEDGSPSGSDPA